LSACGGCGTELRSAARFCDSCGMPVAGAKTAPATLAAPAPGTADRRKRITVLFADLAGSTAMQETMDPETVRRLMGRWTTAMRAAIAEHGGLIDHFAGDGIVATWGAADVREDDALRAVRGAWEMRTALAAINEELDARFGQRLRMRIGVHTGDVVISAEGFIIGDTMNTAARLEQNAAEGEVLIGPLTWRLVRDHTHVEAVEPIAAKGKRKPVPAWRVLSLEAPAAAAAAPFVGRDDELARLRDAFDEAATSRECRLAVVIGSPGIGKSRLADEFVATLAGRARIVRGSCPAYGEGMTYAPVAEAVRELAEIGDSDDVAERLLAIMGPGEDGPRVVAGLAGILGAGEQTPAEETFWAVRALVTHAAAQRPLVLVFDDLHWAAPQFLDLVEHLVALLAGEPVLIVGLARPELRELRELLTRPGGHAVVALDVLAAADSERLVRELLGGGDLPPGVLEVAAGNPLFLAELVRMLVEDGVVERHGDVWVMTDDAAPAIPASISALLAGRLQRLPADERAVVERAAVIGRQFYSGAIAELAPAAVAEALERHLETLQRKELVEPEGVYWIDEPVYRFHHALIRDAAYEGLLKEARATLHERFAAWLDRTAGELVGEHEEVIAFHLEHAHEYRCALGTPDDAVRRLGDAAAARLASAGRRALVRDDFAAAVNLLGRAIARASAPSATLHFDRCTGQLGAGDLDGAAGEVAALEQLAAADPGVEPVAAVAAVAAAYLRVGATSEQQARLDRAIAVLRADGTHPRVLAHALNWKGTYCVLSEGRNAAGQLLLEESLACARASGDERLVADVLSLLPLVALYGPLPLTDAQARCEEVLARLRERPGSRKMEAQTQCVQGVIAAMQARFADAFALLDGARATFSDLGLALDVVDADLFAARVELLAGRPAAAEALARRALAGPGGLGPSSQSVLAQALAAQGDPGALALADAALADAGPDNLRAFVAASGVRAQALSAAGDHAEAIVTAQRAVAATEQTDAAIQHVEALEVLAAVLAAAGDEAAAGPVSAAALAAYSAKGHAVGTDRLVDRLVSRG
jgi:class 3 adenylate cyclase/tetratricopeptide (TPR) repeat protein